MEERVIERYGTLKKSEPLRLITDSAVDPNTLAFECPAPFPGYYGNKPSKQIPLYVYLVLDDYMHLEDLLLMKEKIKEKLNYDFHATIATLEFFDEHFHAIRIRNVEDFAKVREIQEMFSSLGAKLYKKTRKFKFVDNAFIRIKKFFYIKEFEKGYFCDLVDENHGYFKLDKKLTYADFLEVAKKAAYNLEIIDYDAALASYFENYKVHHLIRIYKEGNCADTLKQIHDEYLKIIAKLD